MDHALPILAVIRRPKADRRQLGARAQAFTRGPGLNRFGR